MGVLCSGVRHNVDEAGVPENFVEDCISVGHRCPVTKGDWPLIGITTQHPVNLILNFGLVS